MSNAYTLTAHTDLAVEEIHRILFDGIEVEEDAKDRRKLQYGGFHCTVTLLDDRDVSENWVLDAPENLDVTFYFGWSVDGFIKAMKVVMNWFRKTTGDCAYLCNTEAILLLRVNGKVMRNSAMDGWITYEAMELIDIPHEVKNLGIL